MSAVNTQKVLVEKKANLFRGIEAVGGTWRSLRTSWSFSRTPLIFNLRRWSFRLARSSAPTRETRCWWCLTEWRWPIDPGSSISSCCGEETKSSLLLMKLRPRAT